MGRVFISYARSDAEADAGRLADTLSRHLGENVLFIDADGIEYGSDWKRTVRKAMAESVAVLFVMGPEWRISPAIELELTTAFESRVSVIPVLVRGADFVALTRDLPSQLREIVDRHALHLDHGTWKRDTAPLVELLGKAISDPSRARVVIAPPDPIALLESPPSDYDARRLLDHAEDLAELLGDPEIFRDAKYAADHFDKDRFDSFRDDRPSPPRLVRIVEQARARLQVEQYIRELIDPRGEDRFRDPDFEELSQCLGDPSVAVELNRLDEDVRRGIEDFRYGGMTSSDEIKEMKEALRTAVDAAKDRLRAELPGITKRYPERAWPKRALAAARRK